MIYNHNSSIDAPYAFTAGTHVNRVVRFIKKAVGRGVTMVAVIRFRRWNASIVSNILEWMVNKFSVRGPPYKTVLIAVR